MEVCRQERAVKLRWSGGRLGVGLVAAVAVGVATLRAQSEDVPAWFLVWADEFEQPDGSAPDSASWTYDLGGNGWGNGELQTYTNRRQNSRIEGGCLVIEAREEEFRGPDGILRDYTSARLKTQGRRTWTYGRIEARIQMTEGQGLWSAFWMIGANITTVGWPSCGEIDILEHLGHQRNTIYTSLHGPGYSGVNNIGAPFTLRTTLYLPSAFHLYAVEWESGRIRWLLDNRIIFEATPADLPSGTSWVFNRPFFVILNVAVGGDWPGAPDETTVFPQDLRIDYVRVYRRVMRPPAVLSIAEGQEQVETVWPLEFPHAWLQRAESPGATLWEDLPIEGVRRENEFVAKVAPGVYRLAWNP